MIDDPFTISLVVVVSMLMITTFRAERERYRDRESAKLDSFLKDRDILRLQERVANLEEWATTESKESKETE